MFEAANSEVLHEHIDPNHYNALALLKIRLFQSDTECRCPRWKVPQNIVDAIQGHLGSERLLSAIRSGEGPEIYMEGVENDLFILYWGRGPALLSPGTNLSPRTPLVISQVRVQGVTGLELQLRGWDEGARSC